MRRRLVLMGVCLAIGIGLGFIANEMAHLELPFKDSRKYTCGFKNECDENGLCSSIDEKVVVDANGYGEPFLRITNATQTYFIEACFLTAAEACFSTISMSEERPAGFLAVLTIAANGDARLVWQESLTDGPSETSIQLGTCQSP